MYLGWDHEEEAVHSPRPFCLISIIPTESQLCRDGLWRDSLGKEERFPSYDHSSGLMSSKTVERNGTFVKLGETQFQLTKVF